MNKIKNNIINYTIITLFLFYFSPSFSMNDFYGEVDYDNTKTITRFHGNYTKHQTNNAYLDSFLNNWVPNLATSCLTSCCTLIFRDLSKGAESKIYKNILTPCGTCLVTCTSNTFKCCGKCYDDCGKCCKKCCDRAAANIGNT